jgi:hypothetical protein
VALPSERPWFFSHKDGDTISIIGERFMRLRRNIIFARFGPFGLGLCLALAAIADLARAGGSSSDRPDRANQTYRASS